MIRVTSAGSRKQFCLSPRTSLLAAALLTFFTLPLSAQTDAPVPNPPAARITTADLADFDSLPEFRRKLIAAALAVLNESPWLPYLNDGAAPEEGGFDCSGAMYFVMRKVGLDPPRSSGAQFDWLKEKDNLHEVAADATDQKDASLAELKPGDLLFWTKMESPPDGPPSPRVHHVAMYLGVEKKDGRPVMINSTDGRSYRGQKANGYGVYDFRVPKPDSLSKLAGYGPPPESVKIDPVKPKVLRKAPSKHRKKVPLPALE